MTVETISRKFGFEGISDSHGGLSVNHYSKIENFKLSRPIQFQSVAALTGEGIDRAMNWIMKTLPNCKRTEELAERI